MNTEKINSQGNINEKNKNTAIRALERILETSAEELGVMKDVGIDLMPKRLMPYMVININSRVALEEIEIITANACAKEEKLEREIKRLNQLIFHMTIELKEISRNDKLNEEEKGDTE